MDITNLVTYTLNLKMGKPVALEKGTCVHILNILHLSVLDLEDRHQTDG